MTLGRRIQLLIAAAVLAGLGSGCATVFASSKTRVNLASMPDGAAVTVNGTPQGVTPTTLALDNERDHVITFRKAGFEDATCALGRKVRVGFIFLDILFGIWPALVDAATDSWYRIDPTSCNVVLTSRDPVPRPAAPVAATTITRASIKTKGTKCAIMPLQAVGVDKEVVKVIDEVLLAELQKAGFEAIGPDDINAMLGFERAKEAVGCDEVSCVAELGGALGVDNLITGKVANMDGSSVLTLKLMDVRNARILARVNRLGGGSVKDLPRLVIEAVAEMVVQSKI